MRVSRDVLASISTAEAEGRVSGGLQTRLPVPPVTFKSEKHFQAAILKECRLMSLDAYHTHNSRRSQAGFPDLVIGRPGSMLVAELKVQPNTASPEQLHWLDLYRSVGIPAYLWYPEDWPAIMAALQAVAAGRSPFRT